MFKNAVVLVLYNVYCNVVNDELLLHTGIYLYV